MRKLLRNAVVLCDPITIYFIQYSLYFLILSMALLSTTLPLSLTNVLLLILMTVLVIRALQTETQIKIYQRSTVLLYFIKYSALVSMAIRYAFEFYLLHMTNQRIADPTLTYDQDSQSNFYHVTGLLFGYTSDLFFVRMLAFTLILLISNLQLGVMGNQVLEQIIVEADQIHTSRERKMTGWGQIKVYTIFLLHLLLPVTLLGVIFLLVARNPSLLGLISMFATVIILDRHQGNFWMESYKTIGLLTQVFVAVTYVLDYMLYLLADKYPGLVDPDSDSSYNFLVNALHSNLEYFNADQKFFTSIIWLFVVLAFCFLQKRVQRYDAYFVLQVPVKPQQDASEQAAQDDD